jgi:hypothetical protein
MGDPADVETTQSMYAYITSYHAKTEGRDYGPRLPSRPLVTPQHRVGVLTCSLPEVLCCGPGAARGGRRHDRSREVAMGIFPLGPAGGIGGRFFNDVDDQLGGVNGLARTAVITRLAVNAGETLDHLQVTYQSGAQTVGPVQHGESNGGTLFPAFLLAEGERLHKIEGWLRVFDGTLEARGLRFTTTTGRQSSVLGETTDNPFVFEAPPNGELIAFWGRQGLFLDALGVFVRVP